MFYFDAWCKLGVASTPQPEKTVPFQNADELLRRMDLAGIDKAVVGHGAAKTAGLITNEFLSSALKGHHDRLYGLWTFLPPDTGEFLPLPQLFEAMKQNNVIGLRILPKSLLYQLHVWTLQENFAEFAQRNIPLYLDWSELQWDGIYYLAEHFPDNIFIVCNVRLWPCDRYIRPLFRNHKKLYLELSKYWCADGINGLIEAGFGNRLIYGSGMPEFLPESIMMMLKFGLTEQSFHAAIAWETLSGIVDKIKLEK